MKRIMLTLSALALAGCMQHEYQTDIYPERIDRKYMPKEEVPVVLPPPVVLPLDVLPPPDSVEVIVDPLVVGGGPELGGV